MITDSCIRYTNSTPELVFSPHLCYNPSHHHRKEEPGRMKLWLYRLAFRILAAIALHAYRIPTLQPS